MGPAMKPVTSGDALHGKLSASDSSVAAFAGGALIGSLGGLIGLVARFNEFERIF
jgi:hypothetical protein